MTPVRWGAKARRQFAELSAPLRRAIIHTVYLVEQDEPVFPYGDRASFHYKPIVGHRDWYIVLAERAYGYVFVRIRHTIHE